jgi:Domain of unknown function (DUF5666)
MVTRLAAICALFVLLALPADAFASPAHAGNGSSVYGRVQTLYRTRSQTLVRFDLLRLPSHVLLTFRVSAATSFEPRSAQANVAGFTSNDYALVAYQGNGKKPTATSVKFDIHPFRIYPTKTVSGVVASVGAHHLVVIKLADGTKFKVYTSDSTIYSVNGQPTETPLTLAAGQKVVVTAEHRGSKWFATRIDERT